MPNSTNNTNQRKPVSTAPADLDKKAKKAKKGNSVKAFFIGLLIGLLAPVIAAIIVIVINGGSLLTAVSNFSLDRLTAPILEMASSKSSSNVTNIITVEQYEDLEEGMTYKQVTNAVGNKGESVNRNKEKDTIEYVWIVSDEDYPEYSAVTITFKGGKLSKKEIT